MSNPKVKLDQSFIEELKKTTKAYSNSLSIGIRNNIKNENKK
ncbi:hypothetical protein [Mycoplasma sp. CSL7503-lung]|nr:hypothetical protein [Mycoplasma sp. CSL7503-lung]MCU4706427.1 hypothetical protein [Mycoplasma sp. CSL7503-lung]